MRFSNGYGVCEIDNLPGCSQLAVSHSVFVLPQYRGKGQGRNNHLLRLERMRDMKYDAAICTVNSTNLKEKKHLEEFGWKKLMEFKSRKTENTVELWGKTLNE